MAKTKKMGLAKTPTGIRGLDDILGGGVPTGRPTLVCGGAGCGKTLFAMEFLVRGAVEYREPGVFFAFEESTQELTQNVASLGFDLRALSARKKILLHHVRVECSDIQGTGEYNLEGLFIQLERAIETVGAKRVVLDTIESLFSGLSNFCILRSELRRLFTWLKDQGVTAIITAERGDGALTRRGLEEYVSDCVLVLDQRVTAQTSTRRLRVVKYRGSTHGTNEYPFLIDESGISVLPITSLGLQQTAVNEYIPSGIPRLDAMLGGKGYYRGSSVLVSGTAGTGKSTLSATFADATCRRGERVLYFAFEESPSQIVRNMRSIGINLAPWSEKNLLQFHAVRPVHYGLETHLTVIHNTVSAFQPRVVILDSVGSFDICGTGSEVREMLMRLLDHLKSNQTTALFTTLTPGGSALEHTDVAISSLIDTWLLLRDMELNGERNRTLYILKSRGMAHSNQAREFVITSHGVELRDVYVGPAGVLTGSARLAQEAEEKARQLLRRQEIERQQRDVERKRVAMEAQVAALRAAFEAETAEAERISAQEEEAETQWGKDRVAMAHSRRADASSGD
jgi:circadian clock protein KaiC